MLYGTMPEVPEVATIRALMLVTTRATLDGGATAHDYEAGTEYDLPEWLAEAFFRDGKADPAEAHMQAKDAAQEPLGSSLEPGAPSEKGQKVRAARRAKIGAAAGG